MIVINANWFLTISHIGNIEDKRRRKEVVRYWLRHRVGRRWDWGVGRWLQSICSGGGLQRAMQLGRQLSPAQIKLAFQFYRAIALVPPPSSNPPSSSLPSLSTHLTEMYSGRKPPANLLDLIATCRLSTADEFNCIISSFGFLLPVGKQVKLDSVRSLRTLLVIWRCWLFSFRKSFGI